MSAGPAPEEAGEVQWEVGRGWRGWGVTGSEKGGLDELEKNLSVLRIQTALLLSIDYLLVFIGLCPKGANGLSPSIPSSASSPSLSSILLSSSELSIASEECSSSCD